MLKPLRFCLRVVIVVLIACGVSCAPPAPDESSTPPEPADAAATDSGTQTKPAEPTTAPPRGATRPPAVKRQVETVELLKNATFDAWDGGAPSQWTVVYPDRCVQGPGKTPAGSPGVKLNPPAENTWNTVYQPIAHDQLAGGRLVLTMAARANEPQTLLVALRYRVAGQADDVVRSTSHPGGGDWADVRLAVTIPENVIENSVSVRVVLRPAAKTSTEIDSVSARLTLRPAG